MYFIKENRQYFRFNRLYLPGWFTFLAVVVVSCIAATASWFIDSSWIDILRRIVLATLVLGFLFFSFWKLIYTGKIERKISKSTLSLQRREHIKLIEKSTKVLVNKLKTGNQGYAEANALLRMIAIGLSSCLDFYDDVEPILKYFESHGWFSLAYEDFYGDSRNRSDKIGGWLKLHYHYEKDEKYHCRTKKIKIW